MCLHLQPVSEGRRISSKTHFLLREVLSPAGASSESCLGEKTPSSKAELDCQPCSSSVLPARPHPVLSPIKNHFGFIGARSRPPAEACRHHRQPHWFGNEQPMHFAFLMLVCYLLAVFVGDVFILICRLKMITTFSFHLATDVRPLPHSVRCVYLSCTPLSRTTASPQDHFCLA